MLGLPHLSFSTDAVDERDRIEVWRSQLSPMFDLTPQVEAPQLAAKLDIYHLGPILTGDVDLPAHQFRRDKGLVARSGIDHYYVQTYLEGGYTGQFGSREVALWAGDIEILHLGQTLETVTQRSRNFGVMIPKDLLDQRLSGVADMHGIVLKRETAAAALLGDYLKSLRGILPTASLDEAPALAEGCLALIAATLRPTADRMVAAEPQINAVLTDRLMQYVDAHLDDPGLGIETLCAQFRLSRSYLYRLFEPHGGVANHIRRRRMRRAMAILSDPGGRSRRISEIAFACGFSDETTFGRAFRGEFGLSPSEARQTSPAGPEGDLPLAAQWLQTLGRTAG